jgi:hypothetical protein
MTVVSYSSTAWAEPPTKSEQIKAALDGLKRGARLPPEPVLHRGVPASGAAFGDTFLANNAVSGAGKRLATLQAQSCTTDTLDVYAVAGDTDALWRRMARRSTDGTLTQAQTKAHGQRIRYLRQSGFDYDTKVALSEGSHGKVLALEVCS